MSDVIYAIVFKGEVLDGFQKISVKAHMAKTLKASPEKMKALFSGKPVVIKRTPDKQLAIKYGTALKKLGADVKLKSLHGDAAAAKPKPATEAPAKSAAEATPTAAPDTSDISLAPNEGNLVEAKPAPPPPDLDLSGMSILENDGSPLVEHKEFVRAEIDLSEFSVAENDGSPLVESQKKDVPEVDVPDFGLDEPGAVLETIKEEKEIVSPNTMGMTIAAAGTDLLEEEEKKKPVAKAPDTSSINLVPNFDS